MVYISLCTVLAATNDVIQPLLLACSAETGNPRVIQLGLGSLQKLIQYNAFPPVSKCVISLL